MHTKTLNRETDRHGIDHRTWQTFALFFTAAKNKQETVWAPVSYNRHFFLISFCARLPTTLFKSRARPNPLLLITSFALCWRGGFLLRYWTFPTHYFCHLFTLQHKYISSCWLAPSHCFFILYPVHALHLNNDIVQKPVYTVSELISYGLWDHKLKKKVTKVHSFLLQFCSYLISNLCTHWGIIKIVTVTIVTNDWMLKT